MLDFAKTHIAHKFFEATMPALVKAVEKLTAKKRLVYVVTLETLGHDVDVIDVKVPDDDHEWELMSSNVTDDGNTLVSIWSRLR